MALPVKRSVAVVVRKGDEILTLRRPDNDDELPGVWGLPAASYRPGETLEEIVARIGSDKLGVKLTATRKLAAGSQVRKKYCLEMELWEVHASEAPVRSQWKWSAVGVLAVGREKGSLCCELALESQRGDGG
jgi:ADP-ribose pyrophosphatase YjhB (NUDIX family)